MARVEELSRGDRLYPSVDRVRALALRPKRRPSPFNRVYVNAILSSPEDGHSCRWRNVVSIDWQIIKATEEGLLGPGDDATCERADQSRLGDAQGDDEPKLYDAGGSALEGALQVNRASQSTTSHARQREQN